MGDKVGAAQLLHKAEDYARAQGRRQRQPAPTGVHQEKVEPDPGVAGAGVACRETSAAGATEQLLGKFLVSQVSAINTELPRAGDSEEFFQYGHYQTAAPHGEEEIPEALLLRLRTGLAIAEAEQQYHDK